jgi:type I restriction enzyme M protein
LRSTRPKDIGEHLTKAVRAVVRQNPSLSGVIDVVDFAAERNGERDINPAKLREVVETFSDPRYRLGLADVQPDFLGRAYEYLLRKFAEGSGQSAGEFFTMFSHRVSLRCMAYHVLIRQSSEGEQLRTKRGMYRRPISWD